MSSSNIFPNELINEIKIVRNGEHYMIKFPCGWDRQHFRNHFSDGAFFGEYYIEFNLNYTKNDVLDLAMAWAEKSRLKIIDETK